MINLKAGSAREIDGKTFIETKQGVSAHAVYGPYEQFQRGRYAVEFELSMVERGAAYNNELCSLRASRAGSVVKTTPRFRAEAGRGVAQLTLSPKISTAFWTGWHIQRLGGVQ